MLVVLVGVEVIAPEVGASSGSGSGSDSDSASSGRGNGSNCAIVLVG